uniref:Cyclin B-2 n=1 Tax=Schmidtea mediterranea TaxID=79327 RepID=I1ZIC1_SCHMD|nr:cyclin B-2 [Schmidtea mediterranea]
MKPLVLRNREINMNTENSFPGITTRKRTAMKSIQSNTKNDKKNDIEKVSKSSNLLVLKEEPEVEEMEISISNKENETNNYQGLLNNPFIWPKHSEIVQDEQKTSLLQKIIARREIVRMHFKDNIENGVPNWFITRKACNNEFMHAEYLANIIDYLNECEIFCDVLGRHFLECSREISPRHRYIFINWLVDAHSQFSLCAETLYLAISLSDRFIKAQKATLVSNDLIVIGIVCLFIAAKVEEVWPPSLNDIVATLTQDYTEEFCRELELKILSTIDFKLAIPMPISFIRHYNFPIR